MHDVLDAVLRAPPGLGGPALLAIRGLADWAVWIGPAILFHLWANGSPRDRSAALATGAAAVVGLAIAAALSPTIAAPRPFVDAGAVNYLHHAPDGSFPSDHATLAFCLAFGLWRHPPPSLPRAWVALLVVAFAVGWARVFLGAHHPADVLGGAVVGVVAVWATSTRVGRWLPLGLDHLDRAFRSRASAALGAARRLR